MFPQTFIFYGRSGCGKGTQADLLIKYLAEKEPKRRTLYLETGKLLREFALESGFTNELVKKVLDQGGLLPEFMPVYVWSKFLADKIHGDENLVFDGVCRRTHEAPILDSALKFYNRTKSSVILIEVSEKWARERLLARGRGDDDSAEINRRLAWYEKDVVPTLKFFENSPDYRFIKINGEQSIEKVHQEIIKKVFDDNN